MSFSTALAFFSSFYLTKVADGAQSQVITLLWSVFSAGRGDPGHIGGRSAWTSDWPRRLQTQRFLCFCTNRQRKDSVICHSCHSGEQPAFPLRCFDQAMLLGFSQWRVCVCVFPGRCWWSGRCVRSGLWPCCQPKSSRSRSQCSNHFCTFSNPHGVLRLNCVWFRSTKCLRRTPKELLWKWSCWGVRGRLLQSALRFRSNGEDGKLRACLQLLVWSLNLMSVFKLSNFTV